MCRHVLLRFTLKFALCTKQKRHKQFENDIVRKYNYRSQKKPKKKKIDNIVHYTYYVQYVFARVHCDFTEKAAICALDTKFV